MNPNLRTIETHGNIQPRFQRSEAFYRVEKGILEGDDPIAAQIGVIAYSVYTALCYFANQSGTCWPSYPMIAKMLGIGKDEVRSSIKKLQQHNLVAVKGKKKPNGEYESNTYMILALNVYNAKIPTPVEGASEVTDAEGTNGVQNGNGRLAQERASGGAVSTEQESLKEKETTTIEATACLAGKQSATDEDFHTPLGIEKNKRPLESLVDVNTTIDKDQEIHIPARARAFISFIEAYLPEGYTLSAYNVHGLCYKSVMWFRPGSNNVMKTLPQYLFKNSPFFRERLKAFLDSITYFQEALAAGNNAPGDVITGYLIRWWRDWEAEYSYTWQSYVNERCITPFKAARHKGNKTTQRQILTDLGLNLEEFLAPLGLS